MKQVIRSFWPLVAVVTMQCFICASMPAKSGWGVWRFYLYGVLDLFIALMNTLQYRQRKIYDRELAVLRKLLADRAKAEGRNV